MSNMSITIRNQINAGSGKRAHPEHLKALAATKKEGQGRVRVEPDQRGAAARSAAPERHGISRAGHGRVAVGSLHPAPAARWLDQGCRAGRYAQGSGTGREAEGRQEGRKERGQEVTSARQQRRASRLHQRDQCGRFRIASSSSVSASRASANSRDRNCSARSADASMCSTQARTIRSISASMRSTLP